MVVDLFLKVLSSVLGWVFGLFPSLHAPSWLTDLGGYIGQISAALAGSSNWLPWNFLLLGIGLVMLAYAVSAAIRGIRIIASFFTLGGGA